MKAFRNSRSKKIIAIVQARMDSKRLPGKVLLDLEGKPVLLRIIDRALQSGYISHVVVAATDNKADVAIARAVQGYHPKVDVFRGSENDLLDRWYQATQTYQPFAVVKFLADCPLIDASVVDNVIAGFLEAKADYAATSIHEKKYPVGLDVEVFSFATLTKLWTEMKGPKEREYPSLFIRMHPELFVCQEVSLKEDYSSYRLTLDEPEDYTLIKTIYHELLPQKPYFSMADVVRLLKKRPELAALNQHVEQKWKNY